MPGIDVKMGSYGERGRATLNQDRYNSEDSLEDNQSSTSSLESRQSDSRNQDFKREHEFIPTRSSGILASKPAYNPGQFTRVASNPLLISAQKQLLQVEEVRKKKMEVKVGDETPEWQSNLDNWKVRRRKQSEEALGRVSEIRRIEGMDFDNGSTGKKLSIGRKISMQVAMDDVIDLDDLGELPTITPNQANKIIEEKEEDEKEDDFQPSQASWATTRDPSPPASRDMAVQQRSEVIGSSELVEKGTKVVAEEVGEMKEDRGNPYQSAIEGYKSFANNQSKSFSSHTEERVERSSVERTERTSVERSMVTKQDYSSIENISTSSSSKDLSVEDNTSTSAHLSSISSLSSPSPKDRGPAKGSVLLSDTPLAAPPSPPTSSALDDSNASSKDEEWEKKIESFVQPTRKSSTELSDKMRLKMASFQDSNNTRTENVTRVIQPDNSFKDKLKAFKNIETSSSSSTVMSRRESEPQLRSSFGQKPGSSLGVLGNHSAPQPYRSSSSSALMNTFQNNKFFQQNSLSSEESADVGLVEDALEESFEALLEDKSKPVFSAEDFIPSTERLAPPSEKPPPLPPVPPPGLDEDAQREEDLAKQEREIIESLEREEKEKQKKQELMASSPASSSSIKASSLTKTTSSSTQSSTSSFNLSHSSSSSSTFSSKFVQSNSSSSSTPQISQPKAASQFSQTTQFSQTKPVMPTAAAILEKNEATKIHHSRSSSSIDDGYLAGNNQFDHLAGAAARKSQPPTIVPPPPAAFDNRASAPNLQSLGKMGPKVDLDLQGRKKSDIGKDYNKHWLIQEAEQRRIHEANLKMGKVDKIENINNNASHEPINHAAYHNNVKSGPGAGGREEVSENIYANVDPNQINYSRNNSGSVAPMPGMHRPAGQTAAVGPAVPPRVQDSQQDRVLSVSGKKKCSACKAELGRGAAMIIESLRLFYHIRCFKCCVCSVQLGNGEQGTDVRVRNNRLHCQNCYSNDEGLKFSKV